MKRRLCFAVGVAAALTALVGCSKEPTPSTPDYELRTLTFEGEKWCALIDSKQYDGALLYGQGNTYSWYDEANTELMHSFTTPYWDGGHAISNYVVEDYTALPEGYFGWYELQLSTPNGGNGGSANFAVHNGYCDEFNGKIAPALEFKDGVERVVESMWVMNTSYMLNTLTYGDGYAGPATEATTLKIVAMGYNAMGEEVSRATFALCNRGELVTEWTKWDLTSLGKVAKVAFNLEASSDLIGEWGLACPAYFAYDDITVRFEK